MAIDSARFDCFFAPGQDDNARLILPSTPMGRCLASLNTHPASRWEEEPAGN